MTSATMAVGVLVLLTYSLVTVAIWRLGPFFGWGVRPVYMPVVAWQGLVEIALVGMALVLSRWTSGWTGRPVAMLWLFVFGGAW